MQYPGRNEKGHVERSVEVVRRKAFAFKDQFATLEEANAYLLTVLCKLNHGQQVDKEQTIMDSFKAEQPCLLALSPRYETARCNHYRVDKYSSIMIDTCHYSVPDHLVGKLVFAKVYSFKILVFHNDQVVAEHAKMHACHQWSIKLEHYGNTLRRKPGALASSTALRQAEPYLSSLYQQYYVGKERDFIDLVVYSQKVGLKQIKDSVKALEVVSPLDITTEKIKLFGQKQSFSPAGKHIPRLGKKLRSI